MFIFTPRFNLKENYFFPSDGLSSLNLPGIPATTSTGSAADLRTGSTAKKNHLIWFILHDEFLTDYM